LLERLYPDSPRLGHTGPATKERIRLRADPALVFATSDVTKMALLPCADGQKRVQVSAAFIGLSGSVSPLPAHFAEDIALKAPQQEAQPVREFLDVFHHRLMSLVYRAWSKYRLSVGYLKKGKDSFTRRMFCAVGLDGFADADDHQLHPFYFLRFAPLLASKSRSARSLEVVLHELLGDIGVGIEQFVGAWVLIEKPLRNKLGIANHQLGESLVIGRYVYDGSGRFTVKLGPLEYDDYLSFLPGGHRRPFLKSVINTFTPGIHDVMLELQVDLDAAPRFQLGSPRAATLARTAWLGGSGAQSFSITVPLEDRAVSETEDHDEDRGEAPPLP
jgi:type VI secretion system protein ImpH